MNLYKNSSFLLTNDIIIGKLVIIFFAISLFYGCQSSKFLKEGTNHLDKNRIEFYGEIGTKERGKLRSEISSLYSQTENTNWLFFIPREYIYYTHNNPNDKSWYYRSVRKYLAEKPAIYNVEHAKETSNTIEKYLINKKGYFNAKVSHESIFDTVDRKVIVYYDIDLYDQYKINDLTYDSDDKTLLSLINNNLGNAHIHSGDPIDEGFFNLEKSRISNLLQNSGYANFNSNFIQIKGDSTRKKGAVDILITIKTPGQNINHDIYKIGSINVHVDYNQTKVSSNEPPELYKGINYYKKGEKFIIRPSQMNSFLYIRPGEIYNKSKKQKTYRKLSQLSPYQYVNINKKLNPKTNTVDYDVYLTPHKKKWVENVGIGSYYSNSKNNRIGFSINNKLINRNLFRGAERFFLDSDIGYEFQFVKNTKGKNEIKSNQNFNIQAKTEIPKLIDLLGEFIFLKKLGFISKEKYDNLKEETNTELKLGYNYTNQINIGLFKYHKFNISTGYNYQPTINTRYYYEPLAFTLFNPTPSEAYQTLLDSIPLLKKSFSKSFTSGLIFSNLSYNYQKSIRNGQYFSWFNRLEISGFENYLYNSILKVTSPNATPWNAINDVKFSRFIKLNLELRFSQRITERAVIASRINTGIATPIGNSEVIPYLKQFFIGGPNSVRAWSERELGPGGYIEKTNPSSGIASFYQSGDVLMEANTEFRFSLFETSYLRFEIAGFIDAGNIWTLKFEENRKESQFTSHFYNQIAIGAGYGLRFDFDFFLIRVDFAYKMRDPYPNYLSGNHWDTKNSLLGNINLAINHPF